MEIEEAVFSGGTILVLIVEHHLGARRSTPTALKRDEHTYTQPRK